MVETSAIFSRQQYLNNLNIIYKSFNIDIYQLYGVRFKTQAKA
jgi:hypothetical protein